MHILFCNYEYPPLGGGGGVINALLAEELAKRHDVTVLTSQGLGLSQKSMENGVNIVRVPVFFRKQKAAANVLSMLAYLPMGIIGGRKLLKANDIDIINTHFALPSGPVGNALSHYAHIPNVLSVHGGDLYDPSKGMSPHRHAILRTWIRKLIRNADAVVGQSSNTIDNLKQYYVPDADVHKIPLGINRPVFDNTANRSAFGFAPQDILLVTVGRLVARKAIEQLIDLVARLDNPDVKLAIVGSGPLEDMLRNKASQMNLSEKIFFMGHVTEKEKLDILQCSDVFVSASQHEGFGLVYLEAMACSLPVVCYDYGGQTDFLEDNVSGSVVELNNTDALAESCKILVQNTDLRKSIGQANNQKVEELYIDQCARKYEEVFEKTIEEYPK